MRLLRTVLALAVLAAMAALPAGAMALAAATQERLGTVDVAVAEGAQVDPADVARLDQAAAALRDRGFRTKFAIEASNAEVSPDEARALRRRLGVAAVIVVGPSRIAVGAVRGAQSVIDDARPLLRADRIGGMIAIAERLAAGPSGGASGSGGGGEEASPARGLATLGVLVAIIAGLVALFRRGKRRAEQRRLEERRAALEPLVDALAAKIVLLEPQMDAGGPGAERARASYDEAVLAFGEARDALPGARTDAAISAVRRDLERGLRAAQAAEARLGGREPAGDEPLLGGLCTFDPKHGRAAAEVEITTPAGDPATVPACERCAAALERGEEPEFRRVPQGGRQVPYWQGAGAGGFGGMLFPVVGGFLIADLLTPDVLHAAPGDWGGGADFGGDFGGAGDFGGDFGGGWGGDFGGGGDF